MALSPAIATLRAERKALQAELARYAITTNDQSLLVWLRNEEWQFIRSLRTMNDARKRAIEAGQDEIIDPAKFGEFLKYANELEQLAIREEALHEAYLKRIISDMKARKQRLGLP
jgi:hypothetical protein